MFAIALPPETTRLLLDGKIGSIGRTREDALDITELSLRGTFAQVARSTLARDLADYENDFPAYVVSNELLEELGLPIENSHDSVLFGGFRVLGLDELTKDGEAGKNLGFVPVDVRRQGLEHAVAYHC